MRKEVFTVPDEMEARVAQLRAEGRDVIRNDNPLRGVKGFNAFKCAPANHQGPWASEDEDLVMLEFLVYGRELQPTGNEYSQAEGLTQAWEQHKDHAGFHKYCNPLQRTVGFLCYCMASDGTCFVSAAPVTMYKELRAEVQNALRTTSASTEV